MPLGVMFNIPSDAPSKFLAFVGLLAMSGSFSVWYGTQDSSVQAVAAAKAAAGESAELSRQYAEAAQTLGSEVKRVETSLARAKELKAAGNAAEANRLFDELLIRTDQVTAGLKLADATKASLDKKRIDVAGLSAAAASHQANAERKQQVSMLVFLAGAITFVLGCIAWARATRSTSSDSAAQVSSGE
jgi:hypothetical protein